MDYELSAQEQAFAAEVRALAERELAPRALEADRQGAFPVANLPPLVDAGLLAMAIPAEYGGRPRSTLEYALAMEELSAACAATAVLVSVHNSLVAEPLARWGTPEQRAAYLPELARGERIGAFALTEPSAGSDAASLQTRARRDTGGYRLRGSKCFTTNSRLAGLFLVFATLDPSQGARAITAFLVERDTPGFTIGPADHKLGIRASPSAQLFFDDCFVPETRRLGGEGEGWRVAMSTLDSGRIGIAAQALGIARAAYEASLAWVRRQRAASAVGQGAEWVLADMSVRLDAARLLVHRAAALKDAGRRVTREAAAAKLFASETAMWLTSAALDLHGADACALDTPVQRYFRDAKITEIYEGTSEIQRVIIAEQLLRAAAPAPAGAG
ncbi:MAG: acyl-CoA dehydrogenase family protein [Chloroflexi bacterium]|nr:acyl-CoA dehydrogenase family protein [Chloroflexota bacterium]